MVYLNKFDHVKSEVQMSDEKYLISVITPFRNTEKELFKRGFESLKNQSIGFENLEWIIVIHNSEKKYQTFVKKMTEGYENIRVFILNDEYMTPSSPRNLALEKATGKYIAFMDSDDYFMENGLEDVYRYIEKKHADVASFRAETEKEDEFIDLNLDMRTFYDQTEDCICIEKGNPEIKKLITIANMTVWSKMIRRDLIKRANLKFDLSLRYSEGAFFCLTALIASKKTIILPKIIAYVHYLNHAAVTQQQIFSRDDIMTFKDDVLECVSLSITNGIGSPYYAWTVLGLIANIVESSARLSKEDKNAIAEDVKMIIELVSPLRVSTKFFGGNEAEKEMLRVRRVLLGEYSEHKITDEENLQRILNENKGCELGRKYGFSLIRSIKEYQDRVPVSTYADYKPYIDLTTKLGESEIFYDGRIVSYISYKDSKGNCILMPQSAQVISRNRRFFISALRGTEGSTFAMFEGMPVNERIKFKDGGELNTIWGEVLDERKGRDVFNSHQRQNKYGTLTCPYEIMYPQERADFTYVRFLFALAEENVTHIMATSAQMVYEHLEYLEKNYESLINDLEKGEITGGAEIPPQVKKTLKKQLKAQPERAAALRKIFDQGFDDILLKIWPGLKRISAIGTGSFAEYVTKIKRFGKDVPYNNGYLLTAESIIAEAEEDNTDVYTLLENESFIEFAPESGRGKIVSAEGVKPGRRYEILLTSESGLYRFRTGDIVEIDRVRDGHVYLRYCGRL